MRLKPHHWRAAYACLGLRNREAALRICPVVSLGGKPLARQFNLEFRPMDATASPHLAMAAVLIAGRLGMQQRLPLGAVTDVDPDSLGAEERARRGIEALPGSLEEALRLLADDRQLREQLPPALLDTYFAMKRQELALTRDLTDEEVCQRYASLY
jgi:glutamine synthetase